MTYNLYNRNNGDCASVVFETEEQLNKWLLVNRGWESKGALEMHYLPTRHIRMQSEEEFAGWGS